MKTDNLYICQDHFLDEDYRSAEKITLNINVVPKFLGDCTDPLPLATASSDHNVDHVMSSCEGSQMQDTVTDHVLQSNDSLNSHHNVATPNSDIGNISPDFQNVNLNVSHHDDPIRNLEYDNFSILSQNVCEGSIIIYGIVSLDEGLNPQAICDENVHQSDENSALPGELNASRSPVHGSSPHLNSSYRQTPNRLSKQPRYARSRTNTKKKGARRNLMTSLNMSRDQMTPRKRVIYDYHRKAIQTISKLKKKAAEKENEIEELRGSWADGVLDEVERERSE
ncbi:hypothetical protein QAD02_011906 [Eretmocerus hayati]|uniref:Uncharacterized protein n=1 Tax=Eretmocerus hayati TaxID=131215 RepID=A0ACC2NXU2_9HYME|nr:hypothetical protein QAD02_011906 [Eretmocerus hayati]